MMMVAIVEIGGTVGDIESLPFLEAVRQMRLEMPLQDTCFVHMTLLPFVQTAGRTQNQADPAFSARTARDWNNAGLAVVSWPCFHIAGKSPENRHVQ